MILISFIKFEFVITVVTCANGSLSAEEAEECSCSVRKEDAPERSLIVEVLASLADVGATAERAVNEFVHF
jgi:hypothetical protein